MSDDLFDFFSLFPPELYPPGDAYMPGAAYWADDGSLRVPEAPRCFYGLDLRAVRTTLELLRVASHLSDELAPGSSSRGRTASQGPELARELWAAMRRIGGAAPPRMPAALLEYQGDGPERKLWVDYLRGNELPFSPEMVLDALDAVAAWCRAWQSLPAVTPRPASPLSISPALLQGKLSAADLVSGSQSRRRPCGSGWSAGA